MNKLSEQAERIHRLVWETDTHECGRMGRWVIFLARLCHAIFRKFADGILTLRAMGLVYTTLLSLVPLLAVSFSVLKAFGVHNQIEPFLMEFLLPLGEKGVELADRILEFVGNVQVGVLGSVGIAFLFYTVVSLMQKIEEALNDIWYVNASRSLGRRFADYLSVILIGPVLIFTALTMAASVRESSVVVWLASVEPFGTLIVWMGKLVPYLLVCGAFSFIYGFVPNTRVRIDAAVAGGVFTGLLWFSSSKAFAFFVVDSTNYNAIYSGFASAVLFMVWLYVGWLIVLVGAQVAFYWQHEDFLEPVEKEPDLSPRQREQLGLAIMALVGHAHFHDEAPWTQETLAGRLGLQHKAICELLDLLVERGLLVVSDGTPPAYYPARDIETITLLDVYREMRRRPDEPDHLDASLASVGRVLEDLDDAVAARLEGRSVRDLALSLDDGQAQADFDFRPLFPVQAEHN